MILTTTTSIANYIPLNHRYKAIVDFLCNTDISLLPPGRTDILGDELYVNHVLEGKCRPQSEALLEAHRLYTDVQIVLEGKEIMGWRPIGTCERVDKVYDPIDDIEFYADDIDTCFPVLPGQVAIFSPFDAHAPLIGNGSIHKLIFKVRAD